MKNKMKENIRNLFIYYFNDIEFKYKHLTNTEKNIISKKNFKKLLKKFNIQKNNIKSTTKSEG